MFIYEIPNDIKRQLIRTLDYNDDWKELGGIHMGYKVFDIQEIESESRRTQSSPTNHLLNRWSQQNHKVVELFILLARMEHVPAMQCLKSVVPKEYHRLIDLSQIKSQSNPMSGVHDSNNNAPNATRPAGHSVPSGIVSRDSNWVPILIAEIEKGNKIQASSKILNIQSDTSCTNDSMPRSVSDGLVDSASAIPMISYHELVEATNNWHPSNILGKGGFGVVYKGDWKHTAVAIKQLRLSVALEGESLRELKFLNSCRHDNVLPLYGYSVGGKEPCLVYQLMTGGSLEQRLKCKDGRPPLTWKQRLAISRGIACGLQYLHNAPNAPLIHGDIKTANILLDTCGEPRIGDFGLARRGPHGDDRTHLKVSRVHGTLPYLPDELIRGRRLSPAVDTFSFGVVLFEIATALPPVDPERGADKFLKDFIPNVCFNGNDVAILEDPRLIGTIESNSELCRKLIQLGMECSKPKPAERPGMVQVWQNLMNF